MHVATAVGSSYSDNGWGDNGWGDDAESSTLRKPQPQLCNHEDCAAGRIPWGRGRGRGRGGVSVGRGVRVAKGELPRARVGLY